MHSRPYVISWNLTYRCNLACEHCYLDAGAVKKVDTDNFSDRSELTTEECFSIIDQIVQFAPECLTILTGGEPLLRRDILDIIDYAAEKKLWVVVGTNGVKISENLAQMLKARGARGFALSLDGLNPEVHDRFRMVRGAFENTVQGAKILRDADFPFIIQTSVGNHNLGELEAIADFAHEELGAKVWNLYFLVQTGRGQFVSDITDKEYEGVLETLSRLQGKFQGKMMVNAKCAPHFTRYLFENDRESPFLKGFTDGAGGCPAGTHYMGIRPNGDVTPCPYLPVFGGTLRKESLENIWKSSELFTRIRARDVLGGRCGACEFSGRCGGCRARAFGMTGDYMAEDPLCDYQPGKFERVQVEGGGRIDYGVQYERTLEWEASALNRMEQIPAFVRGMVFKSVESYCEKNQISKVTTQKLEEIRAKMPTQKLFGRFRKEAEHS